MRNGDQNNDADAGNDSAGRCVILDVALALVDGKCHSGRGWPRLHSVARLAPFALEILTGISAGALALLLVAGMSGCRGEPSRPASTAAVSTSPLDVGQLTPSVPAPGVPTSGVSTLSVDAGESELERLEHDVSALLTRACNQCHTWSTSAIVRMRSSCPSGGPLVVPFAPERSAFYGKIAGAPMCGGAMPPTGSLARQDVDVVRAWILKGAPVDGKVSTWVVEVEPEPVELDLEPAMN